jgi:hypothetical protein
MATKDFRVTPENVVALATLFRGCADVLAPIANRVEERLWLRKAWMNDPVSIWARLQFNQYFVEGPQAFAKVVRAVYGQHKAMTVALVSAAEQYGLTEELAAAGFTQQGHR